MTTLEWIIYAIVTLAVVGWLVGSILTIWCLTAIGRRFK